VASNCVCFNSVYCLTVPLSLKEISEGLKTVQYKWFDIDIQLGIPHYKLKEFEKEEHSFAAVIDYWLNGNVENAPISWEYLIVALKSLGELNLAEALSTESLEIVQGKEKEGKAE